jgi:hypothetical protein
VQLLAQAGIAPNLYTIELFEDWFNGTLIDASRSTGLLGSPGTKTFVF